LLFQLRQREGIKRSEGSCAFAVAEPRRKVHASKFITTDGTVHG
jgi:hypothetical protein